MFLSFRGFTSIQAVAALPLHWPVWSPGRQSQGCECPGKQWHCSALAGDSSRAGSGSWLPWDFIPQPEASPLSWLIPQAWIFGWIFGNWQQDQWSLWMCVRRSSRGRGDGAGEGGWWQREGATLQIGFKLRGNDFKVPEGRAGWDLGRNSSL